jgi:hypothetical protein
VVLHAAVLALQAYGLHDCVAAVGHAPLEQLTGNVSVVPVQLSEPHELAG